MHAFVITLNPENSPSNIYIRNFLERNGYVVEFVLGVNGKEMEASRYFHSILHYHKTRHRLLSPSELGCGIAHSIAWKRILDLKLSSAVVFEDDVILDEDACRVIVNVDSKLIDELSFVHLGGMSGMEDHLRNIRGRLVSEMHDVYQINHDDLGWLSRMVGYIVSKSAASTLKELFEAAPFLIDDFEYICTSSDVRTIYFTNAVSHPLDLSNSRIEQDRLAMKNVAPVSQNSLMQRLMAELNKTIAHRLRMAR